MRGLLDDLSKLSVEESDDIQVDYQEQEKNDPLILSKHCSSAYNVF
jgi:hypothetical protein